MVAGREASPSDVKNTERLKAYWATGAGRQKWVNDPHPYTRLVELLSKYVGPGVVHGLAANIFHDATGEYPGQRAKGQRL